MSDVALPTSRPMAGILWMLLTGLQFVAVTALVKHVGKDVPVIEAAFLRFALGLVFLFPVLVPAVRVGVRSGMLRLFGLRGAIHSVAVTLWFFSMTQIPLAEVTALNYASPVYVTLGAALFLGETLSVRRLSAVGVALIGALIILRPGVRELSAGHFAMLGTGLFFAMSFLTAKVLVGRVAPYVVVGWLSLTVTVFLLPLAVAVWVWPTWVQLGWLLAVAGFATGGHYTMTLAFRAAPMAVTQPVTFLQLVWAVALGALVFSEPVDGWVVLGGMLILGAVSFIAWREAVLKRRAVTPISEATKY